ncbi:MAG: hypothetical protein HY040_13580 [Planctomycetes bacterium]|nr:hypothetical protein [Planctomycetota bacterium]
MRGPLRRLALLALAAQALWGGSTIASSAMRKPEVPSPKSVPIEQLPRRERDLVSPVVNRAILAARGPAEVFQGNLRNYRHYLDRPDLAVTTWRRLGAKCVSITKKDKDSFAWGDEQGSELVWEAVLRADGIRIWYAEGKVRPGPLLPLVPVKAVVVLRYREVEAPEGISLIRHQADLFVHTDSKTANLMTRIMGPTAGRAAEQGLGQLQLFFSGLCWYLERHPEHAEKLLKVSD